MTKSPENTPSPTPASSIDELMGHRRAKATQFKNAYPPRIELEGNLETARDAVRAGSDFLIAGTYLFRSDDMPGRVAALRRLGRE